MSGSTRCLCRNRLAGALLLLANMARTEQSKAQLVLIGVIRLDVVLALAFGFMRKGSSGGR